jgi:hypothetical protein
MLKRTYKRDLPTYKIKTHFGPLIYLSTNLSHLSPFYAQLPAQRGDAFSPEIASETPPQTTAPI